MTRVWCKALEYCTIRCSDGNPSLGKWEEFNKSSVTITEGFEKKGYRDEFVCYQRVWEVGMQYLELCVFCLWGVNNLPFSVSSPLHTRLNSETPGETRIYVDEVTHTKMYYISSGMICHFHNHTQHLKAFIFHMVSGPPKFSTKTPFTWNKESSQNLTETSDKSNLFCAGAIIFKLSLRFHTEKSVKSWNIPLPKWGNSINMLTYKVATKAFCLVKF